MDILKLIGIREHPEDPMKWLLNSFQLMETKYFYFFYIDLRDNSVHFTAQILSVLELDSPFLFHFKELYRFIVDEDVIAVDKQLQQLVSHERQEHILRFRIKQKKGIPLWVRCPIRRIANKRDNTPVILGTLLFVSQEVNNSIVIESCLDGSFTLDILENKVHFSGQIFNELLFPAGFYENAVYVFKKLIYAEDLSSLEKQYRNVMENRLDMLHIEYRMNGIDMAPVWVSSRSKVFYDQFGRTANIVGGFININALKQYSLCAPQEVMVNKVTGLPNLYSLHEDLTAALKNKLSHGYIFWINVDDFSKINHAFSYEAGDAFLRYFGSLLGRHMGYRSKIYHFNADTFVVIFNGLCEKEMNEQFNRLRMMTEPPFVYEGRRYPYTITAIAYQYSAAKTSSESLIRECEVALKKSRMDAGNKYTVYNPNLNNEYYERIELENTLRNSVLNSMEGFSLQYQPFVSSKDHGCIGAEALLRWKHPNGTAVGPNVFIPLLENMRLMDIAGYWVFKEAAKQCRLWIDHLFSGDFYVSVNVSAEQLAADTFADNVMKILSDAGLNTRNMAIEMTESNLIIDYRHGKSQLQKLKDEGIRIAIDDFGTGYSSLSYLKSLPSDEIKIDKSFVDHVESDNYSKLFVKSIIQISHSIDRRICVEGVENNGQAIVLKSMHADIFQGYLFSKPVNGQDFKDLYFKLNEVGERR